MRKNDLIFSGVYMLVMVIAASRLFQLEEMGAAVVSAKLYPWLIIGVGLVMGVVETVRVFLAAQLADDPGLSAIWSRAFTPRRMILLVLFIAYLALIQPLHFLLATGLFCFATAVILAPRRDLKALVIAAAVSLAAIGLIYLLLVVYLKAFLP